MKRYSDELESTIWESKTVLLENMAKLEPRDQSFAQSLISQLDKKGLTEKQVPWLLKLAQKALNPETERTKHEVGDLLKLKELFDFAGQHVNKPKITLAIKCDDGRYSTVINGEDARFNLYRLSIAGGAARVPGSINVVSSGDGEWYGRILQTGDFEESPRLLHKLPSELLPGLKRLAEKPLETAAESGKLSGNCCFCSLRLTDPRSVEMGYGPICASHFGLEWGTEKFSFSEHQQRIDLERLKAGNVSKKELKEIIKRNNIQIN